MGGTISVSHSIIQGSQRQRGSMEPFSLYRLSNPPSDFEANTVKSNVDVVENVRWQLTSPKLSAFHKPADAALNGYLVERRVSGGCRHPRRIDAPGGVGIDEDDVGGLTGAEGACLHAQYPGRMRAEQAHQGIHRQMPLPHEIERQGEQRFRTRHAGA